MPFRRLIRIGKVMYLSLEFLNQSFNLVQISPFAYLMSLENLRIEVIRLCHVEVRDDVLVSFILEHRPIERDVVEVLLVLLRFKVVYHRELRRIVFEEDLHGDACSQGPAHRHFGKVNVLVRVLDGGGTYFSGRS